MRSRSSATARPVEVSGGRLRALLARLALAGGRPVSTGALVDAVWDDELPVRSAARAAVADLTRCGARSATPTRSRRPPAATGSSADGVDAHRFEQLAADGPPRCAPATRSGAADDLGEALEPVARPGAGRPHEPAAARGRRAARGPAPDRARRPRRGRARPRPRRAASSPSSRPRSPSTRCTSASPPATSPRSTPPAARPTRSPPTSAIRTRLADELGARALARAAGRAPRRPQGRHAAPSPRAAAATCARPVTSFVGRDAEIERIGALLGQLAAGHARRPRRGGQDAARRRGARRLGGPRRTTASGWSSSPR